MNSTEHKEQSGSERLLSGMFEQQAAKHPDRTALLSNDWKLTFQQLEQRANRLAHFLQGKGIGPDQLVGLCLNRVSPENIVSVLAVLKAGGACLPLDPAYPQARLQYMLDDSNAALLLADKRHMDIFRELPCEVLDINDVANAALEESIEPLPPTATADNLFYVLYTSGSTGQPKGVAMHQRPLINLVNWQMDQSNLPPHSCTLQFSPFSFDLSFLETFTTLCSGGTLALINDDERLDPIRLTEFINRHQVARLFLPYVALHYLAEVADSENLLPSSVLEIISTAEQLKINPGIRKLFKALPGCVLINEYGPTETHVATAFQLEGDPDAWPALPSIGTAVSNTQIYILDEKLAPVPSGETGELYVGGAAVARGYLHRPELTDERFIPDPFSGGAAARMYRTGDLARQLPDGNFEYLGRADDQIKIRGYRIELGEIETVLAQIETVKESIVKPWEPQPGSLILAAYIQPRSGAVLASAELRGYLEERLPDYMIPSVFVMIDKMPLTPSGKVDRRALPEPGAEDIVSTADHVAPRNEQEEMLAGIWCGLLGITSVGIYDSFIELGGHSLLAIRMENKARNAGLELNMQRFFERHTIAALMETDEGADFQSLEKSAGVIATIGRIEAENRFPASLIETRFWFLSQFPDGAASYNNAWGFDIDGALDMDLLRSCVATIAQRHDVLRSTYAIEDGEVWRNVTDGLPVDIPLIDARDHKDELPAWKREAASCRFDVNHGPVWSMCVYRTGETGYFLLLNLHHIISDGWSGTIFMSELQELYAAAREGRMAELPELKIRYGDYAAWQAQRLDPARMDAHSSYWKNKLENFQTLELPHDHPRPAIRAFDGATVNFTMSKPLGKLITRRSREEGTTAFMILLAAFKTLLARYCGQEDILVGTPVSNRSPEETEPLIGLFLNTIVLRTDLSGDPTFRELLNRVKQTTFEAFIHQELPFDQVVDQLNVPRETSLPPVYQVAFSLNSYPFPGMNLAGMPMTETAVDIGLSHNDVWVSIDEDERGLRGALAYNTSLFDRPTIERMTTHFLNVLEAACADPSKRVSEVALFPAAEQEQMLVEWNATQADYPRDRTMHELFEEQAALNPDAPAVICGDDVCTYGELNQRANRLAHHLRGLGVGTDTCVGLCLERSVEMVVGMLGILKAGGAYVPIDPAYPAERIRHIVDDSGLELIVAVGDVPPVPAHTSLVALDELDLSACPDTNPAAAIGPTNLAYVIFTSGSTGKPKGVMVEHRGVVRLVKNSSYVTLGPETRSLLIASFAFDGSVIEIWGALLNGGSLMLYPPEKPNLGTLGQLLRKQEINMLHLSAELFRAMVDERIDDLRGVRQLLVGGDVMPVAQTGRVLSELSGCRLINSYGPTENTVCTCSYSMTGPERFGTSVPIGKPVSNSIVYILDEQLNPVPVGAVGELYTGGDGLARGYVNQPGLTAEVFIADPFSADPAARLYRTGDRARWLPDGRIEFCGRHDRQVKIRGYRIELDDVENVLSRHEALAQVAVTAPDAPTGGRCLAAYFTVMRNRHVEENELREYLKAHLPEYMVPQYFLEMDALPLTSSGKINRKSLPRPGSEAMASGGQYVAPRTRLEKQMAQIWCAVLEVEKVGIHDNFFDLGGHSLLLIRALNKAQNEGIQVGLPLMYLHQTIAELCSELKDVQTSEKPREKLPAIGRIAAEMEFPLSFVEARFWFLSQFEAGASNYNIAWSYIIAGELDIGIFRACINTIAERHDVLRSTYEIRNGEPMRVVAAPAPVEVPLRDFRGREKELMHLLPEEARTPFDLTAGPLWRIAVCRIGKAEYQMVFNIHHIISDGWSSRLFMSELQELYGATLTGRPADLPELKIRYGDYAEWQRACIEGGRMEEHSSYWENKLENFQTLELPHDRPRPAMQTFNGAIHRFSIARPMEEQLRKRSREEGVTPFVILLAAFKLLLARYSGQRDIVIGTPVANRTRDEVEALLGLFLNTIALRTDLSGDITCRELLGRVQQTVVEGFEHQEVSFDRVVDLLHVTRDASLSPVYQVMLSLNRFPPLELKLGDMPIRPQEIDLDLSVTDLWVSIDEDESGMHGCFDYNTDLFDAATAERMTEHFLNVLVNVCADPSQKIADVALLSTPEREQVLVGWNATQTDYPRDKSIHTIFEEFTAKEPDAVAVVSGEDTFSYAEVNARANRLAHCLIKQGIDDASLVGLSFERSPEMLVCILGILKAGGAYVPLDSSYPTERLSVMVADCEPVLLIGGCDQPPIASGIPFIAFNGLDLAAFPETNPVVETSSENLAYVMYTSGSTGKPKGVMVPHRGVVRLVKNTNYVQLGPNTRTLHFAPIAFDASTFELWAPLLNGGSVVVYPAEKPSLQMLGRTIRESGVNTLWLTADLFRAMVDECLDDLRGVQQLLAGGDVLPVPQVRRVLAELKHCQLVNGYGPTENTTFTCCYPMPNAADFGSSVPIGRPIANTTVYILDSKMNPVPIGVAGELYTGGDGLARGYLNQPELTAEAFVPDPFSDDPEARLYRTGDRARYLPDGQVEFLGRNDRQVKIRGYRIELDGIENVLGCHEALTQVAVTAPDTHIGQRVLAAYYVVADGHQVNVDELRAYLGEHLPDYMVPQHFMQQDALPVSSTGKIDRRALPPIKVLSASAEFVAPRTADEKDLAEIWCEVLGLEKVGIRDNFFDLGGHSLLLMQVLNRAQNKGIGVSLQQMYLHQTIEDLCQEIQHSQPLEKQWEKLPTIGRIDAETEFPLSFVEARFWFQSRFEIDTSNYNIAWSHVVEGELDVEIFRTCINTIVERHDTLRSTYIARDGVPVRVVAPPATVEIPLKDFRGREPELKQQLREDSRAPFDLVHGPLWRIAVYRIGDVQYQMVLNIHHIISDGWSLQLFMSELQELYRVALADRPADLPELKIRYGDYAAWQHDCIESGQMDGHYSYWKNKLQGCPTLELPHDRPRPPMQTFNGSTHEFSISRSMEELLRIRSREQGVTSFVVLLAAFNLLLARYSGQTDIILGTPVANRSRDEFEALLGLFLNTIALRTDLSGDISFSELLGRVKQTTLEGFEHHELPFDRVIDQLDVPRDLSMTPLYQVLFSLNHFPETETTLGGMPIRPVGIESGQALMDLWVSIDEDEHGLRGCFYYNTDLFDASTIERMVENYQNVLANVCDDPAQKITGVSLLSEAERKQLLVEWNAMEADYPREVCTHALIEAQVEKTPDATAILFEGAAISYAEMNGRANRLAHLLVEKGVKAETKVCVCLDRGPELVIAELAIWKAGGAYVPLDPIYPPERIAYMIEDSDAVLLITESSVSETVDVETRVLLDELDLSAYSENNPAVEVSSSNLAYMIYTSGSTGKPKGVQIEHRPFVNFLLRMRHEPGLTPTDTVLAITTPCFDITGLDFYLPLITGASVAILPRSTVMNVRLLTEQIQNTGTVLQATPATWRMLVDSGWRGEKHLKMLCGGESWPRELADALLEGGGELWNMYGPTETTVWASAEQVQRGGHGPISIGRPVANTSFYILDDKMQPVPIGVTGELWIGGEGVSRGYYKRDELTRSVFIPNPFRPGEQIYKTGDLAKWLPDGRVECLGRVDFQVKVRGFRIELEEIEQVMARHEGVKQAVVNAYKGPDGNNQLAGYFQCLENAEVDVSSLRNLLKESLPDYMVPMVFIELDAIPLTPNGKVNRKALPDPDPTALVASDEFIAPRTPDEKALAGIWREVLGVEKVGIRDNFFELGGHSLLAIRLIDHLGKSGYELRVEQLFQHPTVEETVLELQSNFAVESENLKWSSLVTLRHGDSMRPPLFFVHTAPGDVLMYASLIHHLENNQPCYGFQSLGLNDVNHTHRSIEEMAAHYVDLLTEFYPSGPYMLAGWCYGGTVAAEMARQLKIRQLDVALLALFDTHAHSPKAISLRIKCLLGSIMAFATMNFRDQRRYLWRGILNRISFAGVQDVQQELEVAVQHGILRNREEVYRRNRKASKKFRARHYPGKVELFRSDEREPGSLPDVSMGWKLLADEHEVHLISGDHRRMMHEPNVGTLAEVLQGCIDEAT